MGKLIIATTAKPVYFILHTHTHTVIYVNINKMVYIQLDTHKCTHSSMFTHIPEKKRGSSLPFQIIHLKKAVEWIDPKCCCNNKGKKKIVL